MKRKIKIPSSNHGEIGHFLRNTYNEEDSTMEVVFATGAEVQRFSWFDGEYTERLSMKKSHIRMDRMKKGAPVLNNHRNSDLGDIIGVVESARIEGEQGLAKVKFSSRPELRGLVEDIRNGVIKNISVGYKVHKYKEEKRASEEEPLRLTAVDWEPMEISFVTIPADASAQARSKDKQDYDEVIVEQEESMDLENRSQEQTKPSATEAEANKVVETRSIESKPEVNTEDILKRERTRVSEVTAMCRKHGMEESFVNECVEKGRSAQEVGTLILSEIEKRNEKSKTTSHRVEVDGSVNAQKRNEARIQGVLHRGNPERYKLGNDQRQFAKSSMIDVAREYLHTELNVRDVISMSKEQIAKRALHHSSDFPFLLENITNKSLRDSYEESERTFEPFTRYTSRPDFKEGSSVQLSDGGKLEGVNEHGEYERGAVEESAEKYAVQKFGKIIGSTYELLVNDDLDAFSRIPARLGVRAREKESEIVWGLITANSGAGQEMADGVNLFHGDHNNLGSSSNIDLAAISAGRTSMMTQVDLDGELIGGLKPRYIVVPAAKMTLAEQFIGQNQADAPTNVNPFAGKLQVIGEARLDAVSVNHWYLFADKNMIDMVELARLNGQGPEIFTRNGFDVDGMELKIRYIFNAKVIDHRGFYKNPYSP